MLLEGGEAAAGDHCRLRLQLKTPAKGFMMRPVPANSIVRLRLQRGHSQNSTCTEIGFHTHCKQSCFCAHPKIAHPKIAHSQNNTLSK